MRGQYFRAMRKILVFLMAIFLLLEISTAYSDVDTAASLYREAMHDYAEGRYDSAAKKLEKVIKLDPHFRSAHNNLGCCYLNVGEYTKSIGIFKMGLEMTPDDVALNYNLGRAYQNSGNEKEALERYEQALKVYVTVIVKNESSFLLR